MICLVTRYYLDEIKEDEMSTPVWPHVEEKIN